MNSVETELSGTEDHKGAVQEGIARRAYALYEADDCKDGLDMDHWFRAERELTVPDVPLSVEEDAVMVRIAMEQFAGSLLVISVSHRSLLILRVTEDESDNSVERSDRDILRFVSLPVEIDPAQVTCELEGGDVTLRVPLVNPSRELAAVHLAG
jgi:HSP20 family molecular chaperone IbpA